MWTRPQTLEFGALNQRPQTVVLADARAHAFGKREGPARGAFPGQPASARLAEGLAVPPLPPPTTPLPKPPPTKTRFVIGAAAAADAVTAAGSFGTIRAAVATADAAAERGS